MSVVRKNLMVDEGKIRRLRLLLGTGTESETVRWAVERALAAEEAIKALERLRKRGTWGKALGQ